MSNTENRLEKGNGSDASTCYVCLICGSEYHGVTSEQKHCEECVLAIIEGDGDSQKLRVLKLMGKLRAIQSGNQGITSKGEIVDRRNDSGAIPYGSTCVSKG